jgi:hypothetical protein
MVDAPLEQPSPAECLAVAKFARYTSVAANGMSEAVRAFAARLEESGVLDRDRPSRLSRDDQVEVHVGLAWEGTREAIDRLVNSARAEPPPAPVPNPRPYGRAYRRPYRRRGRGGVRPPVEMNESQNE